MVAGTKYFPKREEDAEFNRLNGREGEGKGSKMKTEDNWNGEMKRILLKGISVAAVGLFYIIIWSILFSPRLQTRGWSYYLERTTRTKLQENKDHLRGNSSWVKAQSWYQVRVETLKSGCSIISLGHFSIWKESIRLFTTQATKLSLNTPIISAYQSPRKITRFGQVRETA